MEPTRQPASRLQRFGPSMKIMPPSIRISQQKIKLLLENHSDLPPRTSWKERATPRAWNRWTETFPPAIEVQIISVQIRNTPEIAPVLGDLEDLPSPAAKSRSSPSTPVVLKKPVRLDCISSPLVMFDMYFEHCAIASPVVTFDTDVEGENAGWFPHYTSKEGS